METSLVVLVLLCGDDKPRSKLFEHRCDGLVAVADVVFGNLVDVLYVESTDDGFNADFVDDLLESVVLPLHLLVVWELKELATGGIIFDGRIDAVRDGKARAVEVGVVCNELHLVGCEDKREETMMSAPFFVEK